ncbi:hypothetical protein [Candidatus Regiella endosymbiont of Tuberolachnus salignus]|uniref:hypothetical protein n=1 Tax=Candidatus Regiella endosymbiont of Tuberolachnus salignus TaxID=3077956 RepID=UPI0030D2500A
MKLPLGGQSVRPMSVDRLRDSANTRSQQRGSFKGEGYSHIYRFDSESANLYLSLLALSF